VIVYVKLITFHPN